jgi:prolyl-tRNA editing enzyme YbaK/EbsC (Cys-tRNA(Pro) deacylase)
MRDQVRTSYRISSVAMVSKAIGGVSPVGWLHNGEVFQPQTIVDKALNDYPIVWGACGHTHVVCSLNFESLLDITAGTALAVAHD